MIFEGSDRKRAMDVSLTVLVFLGAVCMTWAGLARTKSVPASAVPITEKAPEEGVVIVVDAGHGGFDGGAVGSSSGVPEAGLNLEVARLLADELTAKGYYVIMTRNGDEALGNTKKEDMRAREEIMTLDAVDIVVSIHMNKFGDSSVSGPMVFYMRGSEQGEALAAAVMDSVNESVGRPQRYANPEDLFVLRVPKAPSVLVECGFLSNARDEALLLTGEYRGILAQGIANGIERYVTENGVG